MPTMMTDPSNPIAFLNEAAELLWPDKAAGEVPRTDRPTLDSCGSCRDLALCITGRIVGEMTGSTPMPYETPQAARNGLARGNNMTPPPHLGLFRDVVNGRAGGLSDLMQRTPTAEATVAAAAAPPPASETTGFASVSLWTQVLQMRESTQSGRSSVGTVDTAPRSGSQSDSWDNVSNRLSGPPSNHSSSSSGTRASSQDGWAEVEHVRLDSCADHLDRIKHAVRAPHLSNAPSFHRCPCICAIRSHFHRLRA